MSGICRANARQNSRDKNYWLGKTKINSWEIAKAKQAKRQKRIKEAFNLKMELRAAAGKPMRGTARKLRRMNIISHA